MRARLQIALDGLGSSYWLIFIICILLNGCSSLSKFLDIEQTDHQSEQILPTDIVRKQYNKPPLSRMELNAILQMSIYHGRPEDYGNIELVDLTMHTRMPPVIFPHWRHRINYTCRVCHLELDFSMKTGDTGISCSDNREGTYCGICHNGTNAFGVKARENCNRCHMKDKSRLRANFESLAATLPRKYGGDTIDWVKALKLGAISPRNSISGDAMTKLSLPDSIDKPLAWYTADSRVYVIFPHKEHVAWLDCSNCHPDIFNIKKMGTEAFDKEKNLYGYYCGTCHMQVSFPMNNCSRCHPGVKDR